MPRIEIPLLTHEFDFLQEAIDPLMVHTLLCSAFSVQLDWAGLTGDRGGRATKNRGT